MKKFLLTLIVSLFVAIPAFCVENDLNSNSDVFSTGDSVFDNPFAGQKQYTDEDFQKALEQKKSKMRKFKKKKFKGKASDDTDSTTQIDETAAKTIILLVSVPLINGDGTIIPTGHYKIEGVEEDSKIYLDFYQAHKKVARVPAIKTKYDFEQPDINFAKILDYSDTKVKVIFGSLDFNAWTLLRIVN